MKLRLANSMCLPLRPLTFLALAAVFLVLAQATRAQDDSPRPMTPPPEHKVVRMTGTPQPEAPPSLPPAQIIAAFTKKEDLYRAQRPLYTYHRSVRIQEFGPDGRPGGEFKATYEAVRSSNGQFYEKALAAPESSLQYMQFEPEETHFFTGIPAFPLTTDQLTRYEVQYLSTEKVDEVDCYIFQVRPKTLDRQRPSFDGIIWVDQKYLEVVKTYGKWVTDLGPMHPANLPFSIFETYRENVEGKYWFPNYSRSEDVYKLKDREINVRVTIKWSDFKPFPPAAAPTSSPSPASAPAPKP